MTTRKITDPREVKRIYREHMAVDFPDTERPPLLLFRRMLKSDTTNLYLYEKDGREVAYTVFSESDGYLLLRFFAVYKELRGSGIGSELLAEFQSCYADKNGILLEAEHMAYATDDADRMVRERRVAFYQRCGYRCLKNFDVLLFGVHYHLMAQPLAEDKTDDLDYVYNIYGRMYSGIPKKYISATIQEIL